MHVQRVVVPGSGAKSWTALDGHGVPASRWSGIWPI